MNIYTTIKIVEMECCNCGMPFGISDGFRTRKLNEGGLFFCPAGHSQHFSKSENQRLKDELAREKQKREQIEADRNWQRTERLKQEKYLGNQIRAQKGAKTRLKNRIANGVCPCCTRSFQNLHRHMENKHPEFVVQP